MKDLILHGLKVIGVKIAFCFIVICLMIAFTWLFELPGGFRIYSVVMSVLMGGWIFTSAAAHGRKLYSRKRSPFCGLLCGAIGEIPSLLLIAAAYIFKSNFMYINIGYCAYNSTYVGIFRDDAKVLNMVGVSPWYFVLLFVVPLIYFVGYSLGQKGYEPDGKLIYKLVYKDERGDKGGKKN